MFCLSFSLSLSLSLSLVRARGVTEKLDGPSLLPLFFTIVSFRLYPFPPVLVFLPLFPLFSPSKKEKDTRVRVKDRASTRELVLERE